LAATRKKMGAATRLLVCKKIDYPHHNHPTKKQIIEIKIKQEKK
jgi:hypothetical protein